MDLFERLAEGRQQEPTPPPPPLPTPPLALELLDWLQHTWTKPVIRARDIYRQGPNPIRNRENAINTAEILVKRGWLIPLKARQRNEKKWQVTLGPV